MQQFCTYGSVRGASGKPASLPRLKAINRLLTRAAQNRGCVYPCVYRAATVRKSVPKSLFHQPASVRARMMLRSSSTQRGYVLLFTVHAE